MRRRLRALTHVVRVSGIAVFDIGESRVRPLAGQSIPSPQRFSTLIIQPSTNRVILRSNGIKHILPVDRFISFHRVPRELFVSAVLTASIICGHMSLRLTTLPFDPNRGLSLDMSILTSRNY